MNAYDWLAVMDIHDPTPFHVVEIGYKNGARKEFCHSPEYLRLSSGDMVVVDEGNGFNVGRVSLTGELVRLQMRKKNFSEDRFLHSVVRKAHERDLQRLGEARSMEIQTLVRARAIARTLDMDMKIADIEYRGDARKATIYYTADGRVDFRELVRNYAREFRVKIEMRQIGARQESARIGGLGSCGRELCCSTWLTDFKSVNTSAARYQNLSINQTKLSGQCGRLKCCLNYELDTYLDALSEFPDNVDVLKTGRGNAGLVKTDIFKRLMYYAYDTDRGRSNVTAVPIDRIREIKDMNRRGEMPEELLSQEYLAGIADQLPEYEDLTGHIELPEEERRKRRKKKRQSGNTSQRTSGATSSSSGQTKQTKPQSGESRQNKSRSRRRNRPKKQQNKDSH